MNFDLNIKNYSKNDIEKLLDLNYPYYHDQVEDKCTLFKNSLINNSNSLMRALAAATFCSVVINFSCKNPS